MFNHPAHRPKVARWLHDVTFVFATFAIIVGLVMPQTGLLGASFTWIQSSWTGGASVTNAVHPTDQSSWNKYTSASQILTGGSLRLATTTATTIQTDDTNSSTGFNLTGNVLSQVQISGTGSSTVVKLAEAGSLSSGSGADGAITISTAKNINTNTIATGRSCADGGDGVAYNVTSLSSTAATLSTSVSSGCITTNDLVLLINLQADGTNLGNVGNYEILTVSSVSGSTVNFTTSKTKYYGNGTNSDDTNIGTATTNQRVVLQRIPQYTNVTISSGGSLTTNAWNGQKGGVLAFYASGTVTVSGGGLISATGLGYRVGLPAPIRCYSQMDGIPGESFNRQPTGRTSMSNYGGGGPGGTDCDMLGWGTSGGGYGTDGTSGGGSPGTAYGVADLSKIYFGSGAGTDGTNGGGIIYINAGSYSLSGTSVASDGGPGGQAGGSGGSIYLKGSSVILGASTVSAVGGTAAVAGGVGRIHVRTNNASVVGATTPAANIGSVPTTYYSSGSYTSGIVDAGAPVSGWGTLSWVNGAAQTISIKARSSLTTDFSSVPWSSCSDITSGGTLYSGNCVTDQHRYIQYQATLSTSDTSVTPSLDSVTFTYNLYTSTGNVVSSVYDSGDATNIIGSFKWTEDETRPLETTTTLSLRAASTTALLSAASWTNFTASSSGCSKAAGLVTCITAALPAPMQVSGTNRYFQYKVSLDSTGKYTPTITNVQVIYVQNAPPEFNPSFGTSGINAYQSSVADADLGKVKISYSVRDPDTDVGSPANQYKITPSFEYNTGAGWVAIPSQYLSSGDLDIKTVSSSTYLVYSATWDAISQLSSGYYPTTQIRVIANDNEAANNTARTSITIAVDTKAPVISSAVVNGALKTISLTMAEDSSFEYKLTNNSDGVTPDGANAISGIWQTGTTSPFVVADWTFSGLGDYAYVYGNAKDVFGNTTPINLVFPGTPQNIDLKDISNPLIGAYREFIAWKLYASTPSAVFSKYELYRSTDGSTYNLLSNITDINLNYYTDNSVSSSSLYYYKVVVVDSDGDKSDYSTILSDRPDGQGGTDFTAPTITNASTTQVQTTWASIIWTTDEISDSKIEYSTPGKTYGSVETSTALVTSHSLVLQNLLPSTTYYYRIKSKDPFNNQTIDDNGGQGYSFTTPGGPAISVVSIPLVNDKGATITWNTDRDSDSYVTYATDISNLVSGIGVTRVGSATPTSAHRVDLTGLQARTKYYFYVESTDTISGYTSMDNNAGLYYFLGTSYDAVPPVISNISTPVTTPSSVVVVWQTDELAAGRVRYGTQTASYDQATTQETLSSIYHTAVLPSLTASTNYYFQITSEDAAGNIGTSEEQTASTTSAGEVRIVYVSSGGGGGSASIAKDTTPPTISNIKIDEIGAFEAKVSFTTNESALGIVSVGDTTSYGKTASDTGYSTSHTIALYGLQLGTKYHVQIKVTDQSGNVATSEDQVFMTKYIAEVSDNLRTIENAEQFQAQLDNLVSSMLPSLTPPFIGEVRVSEIGENTATITWPTNAKTFGGVAYSTDKEYAASNTYATEVSESQGKSTDHKIVLAGLSPSTKYHFQARAFVFPGVVGGSPDKTFATKAAKISPSLTNLKNDSVTVSWVTQTETSSFVEYKNAKTGKVEQTGSEDKTKSHVVLVQNLAPGTSYRIRAFGYDKNNTLVEGESTTVSTKKDVTPPIISAVSVSNAFIPQRTNQLQTILTWKTDEPGTTEVYYEEGLGAAEMLTNMVGNKEEHTLQHTVILPGFKTGTVYRLQIISTDTAGNVGKTPIRTIITPVSNESVLEVIIKNFEDAFGFLNKVGQ